MTRRADQMASTIRRALQDVLARGLADPRITGIVTVTGVRVSGDFKTARVLVSIMPEERTKSTLAGLRAAAAHLRHQVGEMVAIHRMPQFQIELDASVKKHADLLAAIAKASAERTGEGEERAVESEPPA